MSFSNETMMIRATLMDIRGVMVGVEPYPSRRKKRNSKGENKPGGEDCILVECGYFEQ